MKFTPLFLLFFLLSCNNDVVKMPTEEINNSLQLRWSKSYPEETKDKIIIGLSWALSFLGADLPKGTMHQAIVWKNETSFEIDFSLVGFNKNALSALNQLNTKIKESEEYQARGGIDIGRFIMLTINSSYHYFAIVGMPKELSLFKSPYDFNTKQASIVESGIAHENRIIEIDKDTVAQQTAFVASEGIGQLINNSFTTKEFEVFDMMDNGQFRFGLYNLDGSLKDSADPDLTRAGKPAKCLWCHETGIQTFFKKPQTPINGFMSEEELLDLIAQKMKVITTYRENLTMDIDYKNRRDHTLMELLYISFMEPSAERLALEWNLSIEEVKEKLKNFAVHTHPEFPFLGSSYHRNEIDNLAPYQSLNVPEFAREKSSYEPDFID